MSETEIIKLFHEGFSCSQIAAMGGHTAQYVHRTVVGSWQREKAEADAFKEPTKAQEKAQKARRSIPDATVRRIRAANGRMSVADTAKAYGVSTATVRRIWTGESYKEVK